MTISLSEAAPDRVADAVSALVEAARASEAVYPLEYLLESVESAAILREGIVAWIKSTLKRVRAAKRGPLKESFFGGSEEEKLEKGREALKKQVDDEIALIKKWNPMTKAEKRFQMAGMLLVHGTGSAPGVRDRAAKVAFGAGLVTVGDVEDAAQRICDAVEAVPDKE